MSARTPQGRADRRQPGPHTEAAAGTIALDTTVETHQWQALARCASCAWSASMTGDREHEMETFLRALPLAHIATMHPRGEAVPS